MRLLDVAKYALLDSNTHEQYIDNLIIYEFNLPKIKETCYIKNNKHKFIVLLDADKEELTKLSNGDKLMKEFKSEVDKMIEKNIDGCDEFTNDNDYSELVDSFNTYMRDIRKYKLLSQEETKELFEKYHHGDEKARTILINSNQRLIVSIAKQFAYNKADLMDLIQEGNKGLIKAIDNFDYTLDYKLSTFAIYWIKQSIFSYLTCDCSNIKIPLRIKQLYNRLKKLL